MGKSEYYKNKIDRTRKLFKRSFSCEEVNHPFNSSPTDKLINSSLYGSTSYKGYFVYSF